jgi:GTP-binding protein
VKLNYGQAKLEISCGTAKQLEENKFLEVVFSGRSNVGKSSLLNKILGRKALARVSSAPGKTATINFYRLSEEVCFVDLPGYGYAKVSKAEKQRWKELVGAYFSSGREIALVVQLIDCRHSPSAQDLQMINFLIDGEFPFLLAFTKADKLSKSQLAERMEAFAEEIPMFESIAKVVTSAEKGTGTGELKSLIESALA